MKIALGIQARLSSARLPKKMLKSVGEKKLISLVVEKVLESNFKNNFFILIPDSKEDEELEQFCKKTKIKYFIGPLNNVFLRYKNFLEKFDLDAVVRICGDSPLIDPFTINMLYNIALKKKKYDVITNCFPKTFPSGQSVEIIKRSAFEKVSVDKLTNSHKEHVTNYFYDNHEEFSIFNVNCHYTHNFEKTSIDTQEDLNFLKKIYKDLIDKNFNVEIQKIINYIKKNER